jgi:hypothetical protein
MIQRIKYVDASPSHHGGRLLPNERPKLTRKALADVAFSQPNRALVTQVAIDF